MRAFIVLALIALARADVGGYNYEANNAGIGGGVGGGIGSGIDGGISGGIDRGIGGGVGGGIGGGVGGGVGGGLSGGVGGGFGGDSGSLNFAGAPQAPVELEKEFYTFSAPEEEFDDSQPIQDLSSSFKKNLQVIFIKGPENNGVANAALNLIKSSADSKTAIYVLTKQTDASDLASKLATEHNYQANKPEVHFVKYRTPTDALQAQHAIQLQYNQLGGSTQNYNGGVAPVLNFASRPVAAAPSNSYIPPQAPSNTYLPNYRF